MRIREAVIRLFIHSQSVCNIFYGSASRETVISEQFKFWLRMLRSVRTNALEKGVGPLFLYITPMNTVAG